MPTHQRTGEDPPLSGPDSERLDALKSYLASQGKVQWAWGQADCTLFTADWVVWLTGSDPGDGLRGTYSSDLGAMEVIQANGGIDELVGGRLFGLGMQPTQEPIDGDIGIVTVPLTFMRGTRDTSARIPAIRFGPLWAVRTAVGVKVTKLPHDVAWRIA